jgi:hypothetical protein
VTYNNEIHKFHKLVLCAQSGYFARKLIGEEGDDVKKIDLVPGDKATLDAMFSFLNTGDYDYQGTGDAVKEDTVKEDTVKEGFVPQGSKKADTGMQDTVEGSTVQEGPVKDRDSGVGLKQYQPGEVLRSLFHVAVYRVAGKFTTTPLKSCS